MAESERLKGSRSPVTDYKIGNGGVRDLFKYLMGDSATRKSMKVVKTRNGKTTVVRNGNQKDVIGDNVRKVVVNSSNDVSRMAGERAQRIQNEMAANMGTVTPRVTGEDVTNRLREQTMVNYNTQDQDAPIHLTADDRPMKVRPQRGYDNLSMRGENVIYRAGPRRRGNVEPYQRGEPTIRVDDAPPAPTIPDDIPSSAYDGDPEFDIFMTPPGGGMAYGGKVKTKKKRKKKVKRTYGKSYNY